jgi:enoyl-CoA hydratase/carnithine racemase
VHTHQQQCFETAGGWGLLFTTDIRIASSKSFFWFAEIKRGIVPALISAYIGKLTVVVMVETKLMID